MFFFDSRGPRRCIVALAIVMMSSLSLAGAHAAQLVNTTADGVAMDGYDPVNYFTDQTAAKGSPDFHAEWNGATYWFLSPQHRDTFAADPAKYAPQYNGWCAWAVSEGYAAEVDVINGWLVHDGKLYVNWDRQVRNVSEGGTGLAPSQGQAELADGPDRPAEGGHRHRPACGLPEGQPRQYRASAMNGI